MSTSMGTLSDDVWCEIYEHATGMKQIKQNLESIAERNESSVEDCLELVEEVESCSQLSEKGPLDNAANRIPHIDRRLRGLFAGSNKVQYLCLSERQGDDEWSTFMDSFEEKEFGGQVKHLHAVCHRATMARLWNLSFIIPTCQTLVKFSFSNYTNEKFASAFPLDTDSLIVPLYKMLGQLGTLCSLVLALNITSTGFLRLLEHIALVESLRSASFHLKICDSTVEDEGVILEIDEAAPKLILANLNSICVMLHPETTYPVHDTIQQVWDTPQLASFITNVGFRAPIEMPLTTVAQPDAHTHLSVQILLSTKPETFIRLPYMTASTVGLHISNLPFVDLDSLRSTSTLIVSGDLSLSTLETSELRSALSEGLGRINRVYARVSCDDEKTVGLVLPKGIPKVVNFLGYPDGKIKPRGGVFYLLMFLVRLLEGRPCIRSSMSLQVLGASWQDMTFFESQEEEDAWKHTARLISLVKNTMRKGGSFTLIDVNNQPFDNLAKVLSIRDPGFFCF